ncbi:unnamed protein product [Rotaria sp. Silwood2]|nr:unnamed protein product [Rotaria sp. Silwood2]CAF3254293.1 unnamed protein product [Rotaria sp. Silwood2]CAF3435015.1 unnamed protein product [Rotaria sp. Silwood2]
MDSEIIIESENNHESSITTTPILKSNENKNVEVAPSVCEKKKKKGVFNPQWLLDSHLSSFLREYKLDSTKVLCIACNEPFSIHYGGKNDIDRHIKRKGHINNMKSFSINRQLITLTMKPNKESEEIAAAEGIIDLIEDADESATNTFENLMATIKKSGLLLDGLTSIGADNTNVNMGNTHSVYTLFHNQIENLFKEAIGHFGYGIENLTWNQIQQCIEITKIKGLNEDDLFNEFTELKLTFEIIKKKEIPIFDQIQFFLSNEGEKNNHKSSTTTTSIHQSEDEEDEEEPTKLIRSDQLWAMLFAVNTTPTPNMRKLICFLYSIPASNAYVESIFSDMKHLLNDSRNRMSVDSIAAELQIRRNSSWSCTDMHKHLLSQKELLGAISSTNKYTFKKQRV